MPFVAKPISHISREMSKQLAREARDRTRRESLLSREERLILAQRPQKSSIESPVAKRQPRPINLADELPGEYLVDKSFRLFILQNLAWDYTDTILDICAQQKIPDTKPLVRTVRELRRRYDIFRHRCIDGAHVRKEAKAALRFEEDIAMDLRRFHNALTIDTRRMGLSDRAETLIMAVQDAMLILDAAHIYARQLDREIAEMGIWTCDCCLL